MISQYRTYSPPAFERHHQYKDLSGSIPTVSEGLVRLQRRQHSEVEEKCLRHQQIPQSTPGKAQWNPLKVKENIYS